MKLSESGLRDAHSWEKEGYELPAFDRGAVIAETKKNPQWIHFGSGNIFRAFPAAVQQRLLNGGKSRTGIIAVGGYDFEVIEKAFRPFQNLSLLVILKADGTIRKQVIASIAESLIADPEGPDWKRLTEVFSNTSLQMASFTITEKGYSLFDASGAFLPDVRCDIKSGHRSPKSTMGKLASLCHARYANGAHPIALVSMDNCSHNGTKLFDSIHTIAKHWLEAGFVDAGFIGYIENPAAVSFPWSMIDKITPRPDVSVQEMLKKTGFEDTDIIVTSHNSWTAAFVNAEEAEYLIIEDSFPNGRPPLEEGGVIFTDRETVDRVEKMKVCTCLNPLHTSLALFGCLLGYTSIHREMHDRELKALVGKIGYAEGLPVAVNPLILDPEAFIREVIEVRFPNPFMPDTPQRIATDTSQKLPVRFGETIKAYMRHPSLRAADLVFIPLVLAGWCRYLLAVDDEGKPFTPSPDPRLATSQKFLSGISPGASGPFHRQLEGLLCDATLFGVNLYEAGLGEKVEMYFGELTAGRGAVRKTLVKYLGT
jgi:fructuronate reductase